MKPRLEAASETDEDVLMWLKLADRMMDRDGTVTPVRFRCLSCHSHFGDRRDAELMYQAQLHRGWGPLVKFEREGDDLYRYIWCAGASLSSKEINPAAAGTITYFA